jgi:hypothetical protein
MYSSKPHARNLSLHDFCEVFAGVQGGKFGGVVVHQRRELDAEHPLVLFRLQEYQAVGVEINALRSGVVEGKQQISVRLCVCAYACVCVLSVLRQTLWTL